MPRMPKKRKLELSFFLNERGRVTYNDLCRKCQRTCNALASRVSGRSLWTAPIIFPNAQNEK